MVSTSGLLCRMEDASAFEKVLAVAIIMHACNSVESACSPAEISKRDVIARGLIVFEFRVKG